MLLCFEHKYSKWSKYCIFKCWWDVECESCRCLNQSNSHGSFYLPVVCKYWVEDDPHTRSHHGEVTDPDQLRDLTPQFWPSRGGFTGSHVSVNANSYPLMKNPSPGDNKFITFEKLLFWSIFYTLIHILYIKLMSLTCRIKNFDLWI